MSDATGSDTSTGAWVVEESGFDRERANFHETLFTVGNGRLGTRGSLEEGHLGQLSGTFLAGVYDGHDVPVIDLVNCPDWVDTAVVVGGVRLDVDTCTVVTHHRCLDLRDGLLTRSTVFEDVEGRRTRLETMRCASMADRRVCVLRVEVTPENHAAEIRVETGINGDRRNLERLPLYPEGTVFPPEIRWEKWARARHLEESSRSGEGERPLPRDAHDRHRYPPRIRRRDDLRAATCSSARCCSAVGGSPRRPCTSVPRARRCGWTSSSPSAPRATRTVPPPGPCATGAAPCSPNTARAGSTPSSPRAARCGGACGTSATARSSAMSRYTRALRFCLYHLMIAANPEDPTVNIGANALAGERYRGHVFWDTEIFLLPFYILTQPDTAKALLRYRHHTLDGARANSREYGTGGARYAWESADTGREECPQFTADGANRFWTREEEIHVSADVAYGIVRYVEATGDTAFLHDVGAEILFETSRFWVDRVAPAADGAGYELRQVMGPDEFHSHIDNNAFTNRLAQWHLTQAVTLYDELRDRPSGGDRRARIEDRP